MAEFLLKMNDFQQPDAEGAAAARAKGQFSMDES